MTFSEYVKTVVDFFSSCKIFLTAIKGQFVFLTLLPYKLFESLSSVILSLSTLHLKNANGIVLSDEKCSLFSILFLLL